MRLAHVGLLSSLLACSASPPAPAPVAAPKAQPVVAAEPDVIPDEPAVAAALLDPAFAARPPARLSAGVAFTCRVRADGGVACWGDNSRGQLGDGSLLVRDGAVEVHGVRHAIGVAAGQDRACALLEGGSVWCWGAGGAPAAPVSGVRDAAQLSVGGDEACVVTRDARARCWGWREGDSAPSEPVTIITPAVTGVAAGSYRSCLRDAHGHVWCWDDREQEPKRVEAVSEVVQIALREGSPCVLDKAGKLRCWYGDKEPEEPIPSLTGARSLGLGAGFGCALTDHDIVCWGGGPSSEQFVSDEDVIHYDRIVNPTGLVVGYNHLCATIESGDVLCWGSNESGEVGKPPGHVFPRPLAVKGLSDATAIVAGRAHSCAQLRGGKLACWGDDGLGTLGGLRSSQGAQPVDQLSRVTDVAASAGVSCAVHEAGKVACWGYGPWGETGSGRAPKPKPKPKRKTSLADRAGILAALGSPLSGDRFVWALDGVGVASRVATSLAASCALTAAGALCWGDTGLQPGAKPPPKRRGGAFGGLDVADIPMAPCGSFGGGNADDCASHRTPRLVADTRGASDIVASNRQFCVLKKGEVLCWWRDQLLSHARPALVRGLANPVRLRASGDEVCALDAAGATRCWSEKHVNAHDELTFKQPLRDIAFGEDHRCAVTTAGKVLCSGSGDQGQLGNGSRSMFVDGPVVVAGIVDAVAIVAGSHHSCALERAGTVKCWGRGAEQVGQGRGGTPFVFAPTKVEGL